MHKLQQIMCSQVLQYYQTCRSISLTLAKTQFVNRALLSSLQSSKQNDAINGVKRLLEEFPDPRKILQKLINQAYSVHQIPDIKPSIVAEKIQFGKQEQGMWQVTITMNWPEKFYVEGISSRKAEAETIAFLCACKKMKEYGNLDEKNKPVLPEKLSLFGDQQIRCSKAYLSNIYLMLWSKRGDKETFPKFHSTQVKGIFGNENYWKSELHMKYPEQKIFEGFGQRLGEAEGIAASKALHWLQDKGIINGKWRVMHYSKEDEKKMFDYQKSPYPIFLPPIIQQRVSTVLDKLKDPDVTQHSFVENSTNAEEIEDLQIFNVITEKPYHEPTEEEHITRSREMFEKQTWINENSEIEMQEIKASTRVLPIASKRKDILNLLDDNQVVILSGETGCGKTTQVPQFILEYYISQMKGSMCNIVVTQPRRISAISIASRVASERGEQVGETIGHQVRLNKILPQNHGAILFCSTGMLLRKLYTNPSLHGVSHVIIDEAHERNIQIDFLLILLKKLLQSNKNIKVLMMSATFNTQIFSRYFNNCPMIHVPGRIYPVKELFLEDLTDDTKIIKHINAKDPVLNPNLTYSIINYIHTTQGSGAILCFLPGWHDIKTMQEKLIASNSDVATMEIYPVHSRLPTDEQKKIFDTPPEGIRKVVLATNIAETSITVNDVCFVVNSGLHKGTSFDSERGTSSLATEWITKSNCRQRRGRAGRVQPGLCYNLFSRSTFMEMDEYPQPELLRMPLENVILDCKLYCPDIKAEDFLSMAIQPPTRIAVQFGINELQLAGVLDETETLTPLGKIVVNFATHPKLSVALVYASFLKCLDPVLTICAMLTHSKEPFINTLEDKRQMKEIKLAYDNLLYSDHLSLYKIYSEWEKLSEDSDTCDFEKKNKLDNQSLDFIKQLKRLFARDLYDAGLIETRDAFNDLTNGCNENSMHVPTILAALTAAFYPNVIKLLQGEILNGRLKKDSITYSIMRGQKAFIQKESVASGENELPSPWLIFFSALRSEERRLMMTPSVSCTPGMNLLLFAGKALNYDPSGDCITNDGVTLAVDDWKKLKFSCTENEANLLLACREHLDNFFKIYLQNLQRPSCDAQDALKSYDTIFLPILLEILNVPHIPFLQGKKLKFKDGELLSEDV